MKKAFEYKVVGHPFLVRDQENLLNQLGRNGWELVAIKNDTFYLKRRLVTPGIITTVNGTGIIYDTVTILNGIPNDKPDNLSRIWGE